MKLAVLLSIATLVACDYSASQPETPSDAYAPPNKVESIEEALETGKGFFKFNNVYGGAFPPARFPPVNFNSPTSFKHPFGFPAFRQGILPPISQIVPPQFPQIVPPIVPPVFGNAKPVFPNPSAPVPPSQFFPPGTLSKFTFPYYSSPYQYPFAFPSGFPSTFSLPQKQPAKTQTEPLSTSYGPPVSGPVEQEPAGQAETSASLEPSQVSFPYEPAAPEPGQEPATPHKPAQEYGVPSLN